MNARRLAAALALAFAAMPSAGCLVGVAYHARTEVFVFSDPEGATVLMDGQDTGFTTPAKLASPKGVISVEKAGYMPRSQRLYRHTTYRFPRHNDGGTATYSIALPLFWVLYDFAFPNQFSDTSEPHRLFFKLHPIDSKP